MQPNLPFRKVRGRKDCDLPKAGRAETETLASKSSHRQATFIHGAAREKSCIPSEKTQNTEE